MINSNFSRHVTYAELCTSWQVIEKIEINTLRQNNLESVSEFIESNRKLLIWEQREIVRLDSPRVKVRVRAGQESLIEKREFLHFIRNIIVDRSRRLETLAVWIDLRRIPLAQIELTEDEFIGLVTRLEYPDLTNFYFLSINLNKLVQNLLIPNLKFKTVDTFFLSTLAKFCAQLNGRGTAYYIQNFAITDERARIEIAKICVEKGGGGTAHYIQNFAISDENARIEIAKICAQKGGERTAEYIQNFAIRDEAARIEIAKLCVQVGGVSTARYIQNFSIVDEMARIEIAKISAQKEGEGTAEYILEFAIADETVRIEIAKLSARRDGWLTALYIKNFAIIDEMARIEIAKICAKQNGLKTAYFFKNFAIVNQKSKIKIAMRCARQNAQGTAEHIENFAIREETARIEIAKLCAQQNGEVAACCIENFAIEDEVARINIAKVCAGQDSRGTARYIANFAIRDETAKIEIAKLCARQNGWHTAAYMRNFAMRDEATRIEIARVCAQSSGSGTAGYMQNFTIGNPHTRYLLFLECIKADPKALYYILYFPPLANELMKITQMIHVLMNPVPEESPCRELFEEIRTQIKKLIISKENQKTILNLSSKIHELPPHAQSAWGLWFVSSIILMKEMKPENVEWLLDRGLWTELGLLKDPVLRVSLSSGLYALSNDEERKKFWDGFISSVRGIEGQRGLMLLAIPFFNLHLQGIERDKLLAVANHLSLLQKKKSSRFRNVYQVKNLLHTLYSLASSHELTSEQKKYGFEKVFFDSSNSINALIDNEMQILKNLFAAKGLLQLKDTKWPNATENLNSSFHSCFEKVIPLKQSEGDLSLKYEKTFGSCRNPDGLLIYAAGLKTLREPVLLSCLGQFVVSVLDKTYKNQRYELQHNPHLAKVVEGNSDLLPKWKEDIRMSLEDFVCEETAQKDFDPEQWLRNKLGVDKSLGNEGLTYLIAFLNAVTFLERNIIFSALVEEIKQTMNLEQKEHLRKKLNLSKKKIKEIESNLKRCHGKEGEIVELSKKKKKTEETLATLKQKLNALSSSTINNPVLVHLNLQKACLRLVIEGKVVDKKTLIKHLEEIDQILNQNAKLKIGSEENKFATDVKNLLGTFGGECAKILKKKSTLQVVFTDDPIDLLLCGTDIRTCQKLEGDPNLNKGLLGYLIDGKIRLLAIKDGDKIVARCMLRLLWDGKGPVVFRDRFYPDNIPFAHKRAIQLLAIQVSKKLEVPLAYEDRFTPYDLTLQALGGPAPYEYCDSDGARGVQKRGRYTFQANAGIIL